MLKTLEEMRWAHAQFGDCQDIKTDLRELAIQWIKEMKRVRDNKIGGDNICDSEMVLSEDKKGRKTTLCVIPYEQDDFYGAITILKHFFNISEKDLKETDINEDVK